MTAASGPERGVRGVYTDLDTTFWLTANGARNPVVAARAAARSDVTVTDLPLGLGWAQAVRSSLGGPGPAALAAVGGLELEHDLGAAGR